MNDIERRIKDYFPLVHHNYYSDFINDNVNYDFANPPQNPPNYKFYSDALRVRCTEFIKKCENGEMNKINIYHDELQTKDELIDVLQEKVKQLKYIVDDKNNRIREIEKKYQTNFNAILSLQSKLRKYETFNEWENIEYFGDWEERSKVMSRFIPIDCKSLLDLGCGEMHIRKYLSKNTKYYGCDYKKRDDDTIICDLAKGEFPKINTQVIFIAGLLEYLTNWRDIMKNSSLYCKQLILSYSTIEFAPNRNPIWVNDLSSKEIEDEAIKNGFILVDKTNFNTSEIFNFVRRIEKC